MIAHPPRREFLRTTSAGALGVIALGARRDAAASSWPATDRRLTPLRRLRTASLEIGYHDLGPAGAPVVVLLHGFPYDVHSYTEVAPLLTAQGLRVIVPHLRGHGPTRFLDDRAPRAGQQAAIGQDLMDLLDGLGIGRAVMAGYDWGGRAACVAAALWPERCAGLVSVNGYLIQNIASAQAPLPATVEQGLWYQFYFLTERGRAGLTAHRRDIARILWRNNSPGWDFSESAFDRSAEAFDNPDYVEVVLHSYRHRLGEAAGYPQYAALEARLAGRPVIAVPTITLDGEADGVVPATNGSANADRFTGPRRHRTLPGVGHNPPQEAPLQFARAVLDCVALGAGATGV